MNKSLKTTRFIVITSIFAAISILLYIVEVFNFPLPIFPSFLKMHLDEIPIFITGFAAGPWSSLLALFIKTLVKLPMTKTFCIGEAADFIYSCLFILPAVFFYRYSNKKTASIVIGLVIGLVSQLVVSFFLNIFVVFPIYAEAFHTDMEGIKEACRAINPLVTDPLWTIGLFVVLPFNAIKDGIVLAIVIPVTISLRVILNKYNQKQEEKNKNTPKGDSINN